MAPHLYPVMRLIIDIDGDTVATPADIAYLVFERAYNPSAWLEKDHGQQRCDRYAIGHWLRLGRHFSGGGQ